MVQRGYDSILGNPNFGSSSRLLPASWTHRSNACYATRDWLPARTDHRWYVGKLRPVDEGKVASAKALYVAWRLSHCLTQSPTRPNPKQRNRASKSAWLPMYPLARRQHCDVLVVHSTASTTSTNTRTYSRTGPEDACSLQIGLVNVFVE